MAADFVAKKYRPFFEEDANEELYAELLNRFRDEARILFRLNHPNVVRVFNFYDYREINTAYIVMEYIEGSEILDFLKKNPQVADRVFEGIVDGFSHLQSEGILHRDIRPANILVRPSGVPKIIDFGFGKEMAEESTVETDITYIKTHEGWSYLAVVIDLFSRRVVGWSMQSRMTTDLALQALLSAVWRRKPKVKVMIHSDQGSQFSSKEWQSFLGKHNLDASMSRRGNCHDNAVAESFFQLLKRERIRRRTYITRDAARQDVFDYIEMFYNPTRKHTNNGMLSPVDYEIKQRKMNEAGV